MPIPFHCHECDRPTMNKDGVCDDCKLEMKVHKVAPNINLSGYIASGFQQEQPQTKGNT